MITFLLAATLSHLIIPAINTSINVYIHGTSIKVYSTMPIQPCPVESLYDYTYLNAIKDNIIELNAAITSYQPVIDELRNSKNPSEDAIFLWRALNSHDVQVARLNRLQAALESESRYYSTDIPPLYCDLDALDIPNIICSFSF